jgi:hypothetical protein
MAASSTASAEKLHDLQDINRKFNDFLKHFNGLVDITDYYKEAYDFLTSDQRINNIIKISIACIVLYEKPHLFKTDQIDKCIAQFLPMHLEGPLVLENGSRAKWREEFRRVNTLQVRYIALMIYEAQARLPDIEISPQSVQWVRSYGGGPQTALARAPTKLNSLSRTKEEELTAFVEDKASWAPFVEDLVTTFKRRSDLRDS